MAFVTTTIQNIKSYFREIIPYVYDDSLSYLEQVNRFCQKLNEVINETNKLETAVSKLEPTNSNYYINVTVPPSGYVAMVGDGNTDNTGAFQALANIKDAVLFFPAGIYATKSVTCKNDIVGAGALNTQILCLNDNSEDAGVIMTNGANITNISINGNKGGQSKYKACLGLDDSCQAYGVYLYNGYVGVQINADECGVLAKIEDCNDCAVIDGDYNFVIGVEDKDGVTDNGNHNTIVTNYTNRQNAIDFWVNATGTMQLSGTTAIVTGGAGGLVLHSDTTEQIDAQSVTIKGTNKVNITGADIESTSSGSNKLSGVETTVNGTNKTTIKGGDVSIISTEETSVTGSEINVDGTTKATVKSELVEFIGNSIYAKSTNGTKIVNLLADNALVKSTDIGLDNTGSSDCSAILQDYITNHNNVAILFEYGTYRFDTTVNINKPTYIVGMNAYIRSTGYAFNVLTNNQYITGLGFNGENGISVNDRTCTIDNCVFTTTSTAIWLCNTTQTKVEHCYFVGCGILQNNTTNPDAGDNMITCCTFDTATPGSGIAITLNAGGGLRIINNKILNYNRAIAVDITEGATTSILLISNNSFEHLNHVIYIYPKNDNQFGTIIITDNEFTCDSGNAVVAYNISKLIIANNIMLAARTPDQSAICIYGGCTVVSIHDNQIVDFTYGINTNQSNDNISIFNNQMNYGKLLLGASQIAAVKSFSEYTVPANSNLQMCVVHADNTDASGTLYYTATDGTNQISGIFTISHGGAQKTAFATSTVFDIDHVFSSNMLITSATAGSNPIKFTFRFEGLTNNIT